MKTRFFSLILVALLVATISSPDLLAGNAPKKLSSYERAELNYIHAVESDNAGLRVSATNFLGEMKSELAVIPLMRVLKNCTDEECRIAAAVALVKIGDARGIYAVKRAASFDESKRVRDLCWKFYMTTVKNGTVRF